MSILAVPLILQRVPPNTCYAFRTRKTLSGAGIWYAANRYAGKGLLLAGMATTAVSWLSYLAARSSTPLALGPVEIVSLWLVLLFAPLVVSMIAMFRYLRTL